MVRDVPRPEVRDGDLLVRVHATTVNRTDCHYRQVADLDALLVRAPAAARDHPRHRVRRSGGSRRRRRGRLLQGRRPGLRLRGGPLRRARRVPRDPRGPAARGDPRAPRLCRRFAEYRGVALCPVVPQQDWCHERPGRARLRGVGRHGSAAVQLAKAMGAAVTAVCATNGLQMGAMLGPDRVVDYRAQDFTCDEHRYDLVFDACGGCCRMARAPGS